MSDELDDLRQRVAAARDRLASDVDLARKVELRLNDLARIVEGSLAKQAADLEKAKMRIGEMQTEIDRAIARAEQATGEAARAERLAKENGDLRTMVMTLLEVIEGRQKSSLATVMQKLEEDVSALVGSGKNETPASLPAEEAPDELPGTEVVLEAEAAPEIEDASAIEVIDEPASAADMEADAQADLVEEMLEAPASTLSQPLEDLSEIALYDAADEVIEPGKPAGKE